MDSYCFRLLYSKQLYNFDYEVNNNSSDTDMGMFLPRERRAEETISLSEDHLDLLAQWVGVCIHIHKAMHQQYEASCKPRWLDIQNSIT